MIKLYHYYFEFRFEGKDFLRFRHYYHFVDDLSSACSSIPTLIPDGAILEFFSMELIQNG